MARAKVSDALMIRSISCGLRLKAAVLCFVRNKELGAVLGQIESGAQQHPSFVKYRGREKEGWFNFEISPPGRPYALGALGCPVLPLPSDGPR